jgi:organic radical activating enzyme
VDAWKAGRHFKLFSGSSQKNRLLIFNTTQLNIAPLPEVQKGLLLITIFLNKKPLWNQNPPRTRLLPLATDERLQREVLLNRFDEVMQLLPALGTPAVDDEVCESLVAFASRSREAYIKANDIVDRFVAHRPEFLDTLQAYLEDLVVDDLPDATDASATLQGFPFDLHHVCDLWADLARRRLLREVRYEDEIWRPTVMCIEITQQCNARCDHCASNSSPHTKIRLTPEHVREIVIQAARAGVKYLGLTGGEPFLERETLHTAISTATEHGVLFDYINSNCFWARTEEIAVEVLNEVKRVAHPTHLKQRRGMFSLSVTTEHLRFVKLQNIINVIRAHERVFPGQTLELVSVKGEMFGAKQEPVFDRIVQELGDQVTHVARCEDGRISRIHTKGSEIDVFFNYIVPIGRGEDMRYEEYEHYQLTDRELSRGLSTLDIDGSVVQTITVGWDGKSAPDVVLKCSESVLAGNLHLESFEDLIANGNNDPLIRGVLTSVHRIIAISRRTGIYDKLAERLRYHNSIQGYVSEFMKDPKKRLLMSLDLLSEDIQNGKHVCRPDGQPITDLERLLEGVVGSTGERYLRLLRALVAQYNYSFNFSGVNVERAAQTEKAN